MQDLSSSQLTPRGAKDSVGSLFRDGPFNVYVGLRIAAGVGQTLQAAVVAWQVYAITGSALALAFIGLARFAPSLLVGFVAGAVVDTRDRRLVLGISQIAPLATSALLGVLTAAGTINMPVIYLMEGVLGVASAFGGSATQSLLPQIVPRESLQRAVAVTTTVQQLSFVIGPASGGLILARFGIAQAYLFHVIVVVVGVALVICLRVRPESNPRGVFSFALIGEGIAFVRDHRPILGAMTLDMFAVIFAGADALLPIYARDILDVGPFGYGLLGASKAVGALAMAIALTFLPPIRSAGKALVLTVVVFGLATIGFGVSTWFPLSLVLYGITAGFDQVSVIMRQTIIQLGTPDALRGRVNSVNQLFIGASNQLGAVESGLVTTWANSAVVAVVSGGLACLVAVAAVSLAIPALWRHRIGYSGFEERVPAS